MKRLGKNKPKKKKKQLQKGKTSIYLKNKELAVLKMLIIKLH